MNEERKMFTGNWVCATCGAAITQLPFEPDPARTGTLACLDCHRKQREARGPREPRKMFEGNWTCASCGVAITQLPFQPRDGSDLKCRDCFRT